MKFFLIIALFILAIYLANQPTAILAPFGEWLASKL